MRIFLLIFVFILAGCSTTPEKPPPNLFVEYYEQQFDGILPPTTIVETHSSENFNQENLIDQLLTEGYQTIGCSSWLGGKRNVNDAIAFAQEIGATYVIYLYKFVKNTTSYFTTQSGITVPFGGDQYENEACFLINKNIYKYAWGIYYEYLTTAEKTQYQTNRGLIVRSVVNNSPAFDADMIPGDIILEIDNFEMINLEDATKIDKNKTENVFKIIRGGSEIQISVKPKIYD